MATKGPSGFVLTPLRDAKSEVRFLRLLPGATIDPIKLELSVHKLDQGVPFKAISYTWGKPALDRKVFINGKRVAVRQNCYYVLWQARFHCAGSYVWVDALCIDQENDKERSQQVAMMAKIYAAAEEVLSCLGSHYENSEILAQLARDGGDSERNIKAYFARQNESYNKDFSNSFAQFTFRPYWGRLWIIQELAMAKKKRFLFGQDAISSDAMTAFNSLYQPSPTDFKSKNHHDRLRTATSGTPANLEFRDVLIMYGNLGCQEVVDRIYGILGLVKWPRNTSTITVDYKITPFTLAVRAAPLVEISFLTHLLSAMKIDMNDQKMAELVSQRRDKPPAKPGQSSTGREERLALENLQLAVLGAGKDGGLSCPPPRGSGAQNPSEHSETKSVSEASARWQDPGETLPKKLVTTSNIIGLACASARPGDLIASYHQFWPNIALVLRPNSDKSLQIIGQAFFRNLPECLSPIPMAKRCGATFSTNLTHEDLLVLVGQDFVLDEGDTDGLQHSASYQSYRSFDATARFKRPVVRVSARSDPRAWISEIYGVEYVKNRNGKQPVGSLAEAIQKGVIPVGEPQV